MREGQDFLQPDVGDPALPGGSAASERHPHSTSTLFHPYPFPLNHRARQNANETPSLPARISKISPLSPLSLSLLARKTRQSTGFFYNLPERPAQRRYRTHSFPTSSSMPSFNLAKLGSRSRNFACIYTTRPHQRGRRVELLSFLFARSHSHPSQSLSRHFFNNFEAAEPPSPPSPPRRHTFRFHHLSFLGLSPPFLRAMPSHSQHLAKSHNLTDQRHRQGRHRPDPNPDRGFTYSSVAPAKRHFGGTMQGLGCQLQHETRPMCEVNAGHVFHFAWAQSSKGRNVPGK
jgi:hypothetical protein